MQNDVKNQKYFDVEFHNKRGVSHMDEPFFNLINWKYTNPGKITIFRAIVVMADLIILKDSINK